MQFTHDNVFEAPASKKFFQQLIFEPILSKPSLYSLVDNQNCDNIAFRNFHLVLYNV